MRPTPFAAGALLAACAVSPPHVHHVGVMREVMREGRTEARATLADQATTGTLAVGALTGLRGEFLVDDGRAWVAIDTPDAKPAPADATATLLTAATVAAWSDVPLGAIADLDALGEAVERGHGAPLPGGELLPFTVDGRGSVRLHVARGGCPHDAALPAAQQPAYWSGDDVALRLVGFFVRDREGVVTHMGTPLHVHVLATDADGKRRTGHVERLTLAAGARLRLPAR